MKKRYKNKEVDPRYYETIKINGNATEMKELTEEEFKQGKHGLVWMDNKTGKLVFKKK